MALQQAAHTGVPELQGHRGAAAQPEGIRVMPHRRPEVHGGLKGGAEGIEHGGGERRGACCHEHGHAGLQHPRPCHTAEAEASCACEASLQH